MEITWVDIAVFIILALSLAQPWLIKFGNRILKKGNIEINEYGNIEISYGNFGPSIGLDGTVLALNNDFFIQNIELSFRKIKDNSIHKLEWVSFRSPTLKFGKESEQTYELATGFMLYERRPLRYNIFFSDRETQGEMRPIVNKISKEWMKTFREAGGEQLLSQIGRDVKMQQNLSSVMDDLFQKFLKEGEEVKKAWEPLTRLCYWDAGNYELTMIVNCSIPKKTFSKTWRFKLTEDDFSNLKLNVMELITDTCNRPAWYRKAFPGYESSMK